MQAIQYRPCFVLSGVRHSEVLEAYKKGEFNSVEFLVNKPVSSANLTVAIGESSSEPMFSFKDKSGVIQIVHTTGNKREGVLCFWCRRLPQHGSALGIPIRMEKKDNTYVFHVEGVDCGYRCMYARLRHKLMLSSMREGSGLYAQASINAKLLFKIQYPGETLTYAPDWELAEWNGGSLSAEKFDDPSYIFLPSPNIIMSPIRLQFAAVKK